MTRIAFAGAGSVIFTRNLLADMLSFSELHGAEIALHDIDPVRLDTAEKIASLTADECGAAPRISAHLERREAIDGSDFVLNMVQIGGHEATVRDFEIPARYGLRQSIADTLGIGGIFRTLRTADHMLARNRGPSRVSSRTHASRCRASSTVPGCTGCRCPSTRRSWQP
jgi:alpha-galactosidase